MLDARPLLVRAVWGDDPLPDPPEPLLRAGLRSARRNDVEGAFVRAYQDRLAAELLDLESTVLAYRANLHDACRLLSRAGVTPILIKADPEEDFTYSNFDLVVGDDGWDRAVEALSSWATRRSSYPLERHTKLLLYPSSGPAVHLHRSVSWFDVPVIPTPDLRAGAVPAAGVECLLPAPIDRFRIVLAHAAFQNHSLSLGELRQLRALSGGGAVEAASARAGAEGWGRGFREAWSAAAEAIRRLDSRRLDSRPHATTQPLAARGELPSAAPTNAGPPRLPVPLPLRATAVTALEHAAFLLRRGAPILAARELALLEPLLVAKRRAALRP